ncbi:MAG: 3-methyladenine DNA glycosylase 2, partial [Pseudomonadota bacterium]
ERWPGLRAPGAWDPFEMAVRAILGQQVSVKGARTLAGRLTERFGESLEADAKTSLSALFPTPEALADADISNLGMPKARGRAIQSLAQAVCDDKVNFAPGVDVETLCATLVELPGIGDWTAQYIAMRALGAPDAFPAADLGIIKALTTDEHKPTPRELTARAEDWRPWRAYAVMYLWKSLELNA